MDGPKVGCWFARDRQESFYNKPALSVSRQSKQQILQPLSVLRPKFRVSRADQVVLCHIHVSLHRLSHSLSGILSVKSFNYSHALSNLFSPQDLVFIEEAFERMLLDYDRVFSAMGVPACLWRRTGEIYKGNREFSELVGVDGYMMRDVSATVFVNIPLLNDR